MLDVSIPLCVNVIIWHDSLEVGNLPFMITLRGTKEVKFSSVGSLPSCHWDCGEGSQSCRKTELGWDQWGAAKTHLQKCSMLVQPIAHLFNSFQLLVTTERGQTAPRNVVNKPRPGWHTPVTLHLGNRQKVQKLEVSLGYMSSRSILDYIGRPSFKNKMI